MESMKLALAKRERKMKGFGSCLFYGRAFDLANAKKKT